MNNIAIITARGGSKRIPRKNIKIFSGKPMIAYAIQAALDSEMFETVMVSTDDEEISSISQKYGASVPFLRSKKNSDDMALTKDVILEVLAEYKKRNIEFENFCCIYPCVPFLTGTILKDAYTKFVASGAEALMPVVRFSYPIQRALKINSDEYIEYREPEFSQARSQDLEPMYHDVGMFYFGNVDSFLENKTLVPSKTTFYTMNELQIQDIDTLDDWKMAELKYRVLNNE